MAESRRSVPTRFTAEQPRKLVFSTLDRDLSSEDDLTSDEEIVEENTEVTSDDTEDMVVFEDEEYQFTKSLLQQHRKMKLKKMKEHEVT